jgi:polyhydroxybutyrate depolymerase
MKKLFFSACLLTVLIFQGCKKSDVVTPRLSDNGSEESTQTITVDGKERSYFRYLPSGWNNATKMSLMFVLHGGGGEPSGMLKIADFRAIADREKIVLIYPTGIEQNWNDGRPTNPNKLGINDVNFFKELIKTVSVKYDIDPKSVFSTGLSNGGFMSSRLASELSDKIAAIASVAATMEKNTIFANCNPPNPVSVMYIHGTTDPIVPFLGGTMTKGDGGVIASHTEIVAKWVAVNKCNTTPTIKDVPDSANDGTTIKQTQYTGGTQGSEVVSYVVQNGGHTWPQGFSYLGEFFIGKTSQDMNANEVIWAFFKAHKKP